MNQSKVFNFRLLALILAGILAVFAFFGAEVNAASIFMTPSSQTVVEGDEFEVSLRVATEGELINAVESRISYPTDNLEIIGVDRETSILDIWVQRPSVSEDRGTIYFLGGSSDEVGGSSLEILNIRFRAISPGTATISMDEGVVTAADGEGTDVLASSQDAAVSINAVEEGMPEGNGLEPIPEIEEELEEEMEEATTTTQLPSGVPPKPQLSVPLYPNQNQWYNHIDEVNVFWGVPENIDEVAVAVNDNPRYEPTEMIEGVCCGANIGTLDEGVNYIHVRFQNENGWGETTHYKVAIDTSPPLPLDVEVSNTRGTNPRPKISYGTNDAMSGMLEYEVYVDNQDPITTSNESLTLPTLSPGNHLVQVKAVDVAGNFTRDGANFEILESSDQQNRTRSTAGIALLVLIVVGSGWFILRVHGSEEDVEEGGHGGQE